MMRGFDSIESMNADELLVKRKRGSKRFVIAAGVIGLLFFLVGILIGYLCRQGQSFPSPEPQPMRLNPTDYIIQHVDTSYLQSKLKDFASHSSSAGTEEGYKRAQAIQSSWLASGLDNVHITAYNVLLSFPNQSEPNKVEIVNKTSGKAVFTASSYESNILPSENATHVMSFNGFSPAGVGLGDAVYVNYGREEDFAYVTKNLSIDLTDKIVIIRYGLIFRGNKVYNAEINNASAVILFSDPADVNRGFNETDKPYPYSWWMPSTGLQRGTVYFGNGDPDTLIYPSTDYAYYSPKFKKSMPKIPCQPISYGDAIHILSNLSGPISPPSWHGSLPVEYRIGPGYQNTSQLEVKVTVNNYLQRKTVHNVIGILHGWEELDRYVLLGNHHDAWVYGGVDPQSGSAVLSHVVDLFGQLVQLDYRPRRTLVFCSWDAEENGLIGSTEWVEDHLKVLYERAVAYLNVDMASEGNFTLKISTSPLLQNAIYASAKMVPSPVSEYKSLYDLWLARSFSSNETLSEKEPNVSYSLGAGSDQAPFYLRAGVSCADLRVSWDKTKYPLSNYPLYHSQYDNYFSYENYQDPGFIFTKALTQLWAVLANNIADAPLLPLKVTRYSSAVSQFINDTISTYKDSWIKNNVNIDALLSAVRNFTQAATQFENAISLETDLGKKPYKLRMYNDKIIQLERAFINPEGLPDEPTMKHIVFAISNFDSYKDTFFPGISDTMYSINRGLDLWDQLKQQIYITTFFIQSAARTLEDVGL